MFQGLAIASKDDILAIHRVVSDELKAQIEATCPELFKPRPFDFEEFGEVFDESDLPFFVGKGLVDHGSDVNNCLLIRDGYELDIDRTNSGHTFLRFLKKKS
jgi:hypothetical protein